MLVKHQTSIVTTIILCFLLFFFVSNSLCKCKWYLQQSGQFRACYFQATDVFTGFLRTGLHLCLLRYPGFPEVFCRGLSWTRSWHVFEVLLVFHTSLFLYSYLIKPFVKNNWSFFGKDWTIGSVVACLGQEAHAPKFPCLHTFHLLLRAPFQTLWKPLEHCMNHSTRHMLPASEQQHPSGPTQPVIKQRTSAMQLRSSYLINK